MPVLGLCLLAAPAFARHKREPASQPSPPPPELLPTNFNLPTAEQLAAEFKIDPKLFPKRVDEFAMALSQGAKGKAYIRLCAHDEESCHLLTDFFSQLDTTKQDRSEAYRRHIRHFHLQDSQIEQAERFDFDVLTGALKIDSEAAFLHLADKSMKVASCPRNLSGALAVRAEEFFPDEKMQALSHDLFENARPCTHPDDAGFERLYLRQGMQALAKNDFAHAKEYLEIAKTATNTKERYRVLYWLGKVADEEKVSAEDNKAWAALLNEFPLSFYAIEAAVAMHKDPIAVITNSKVGGMKRVVEGGGEINLQVRWLEALYIYKKYSFVEKWASWIVRENEDLDVDVLHYISTLKIASGLYRSNITMLFNYFKKNPAALNTEGLRLLYPRPFFSMIQDASRDKVDSFLVLGLVRQESAFEAHAVSHANARGLMQLEPHTARRLASVSKRHLLNEKENTNIGVKYLLQLAREFQGSAALVLAAYNAGPLRVKEWLERNPDREKDPLLWNDRMPYMETRDYVVSILRNNYFYARLYGQNELPMANTFHSDMVERLLASTTAKK